MQTQPTQNTTTQAQFEAALHRQTGRTIAQLRATPIDEFRRTIEARKQTPTRFYSAFPLIGRGNVLRDNLISHETIEHDLDNALR